MPSLMVDTDQPAVLADPRCNGLRVATYADLITHAMVRQFADRLVVIDRGLGDPLGLATVADIEDGLLTVAEGADKIRHWTAQGRQYITAYHDRALWAEVTTAVAPLKPWNWVATLDGTLNPDGKYPAAVQFAGEAQAGFHVDVSLVWQDAWHPLSDPFDAGQLARLRILAAQAVAAVQAVDTAIPGLRHGL